MRYSTAFARTTPPKRRTKWIFFVLLSVILLGATIAVTTPGREATAFSFAASIDTMKASRDTQTHPLSQGEITAIVQASAKLNVNYITVDTNWDYPDYIQQWVTAIRAVGLHVWFRGHPNKWENNNGASGLMTPTEYATVEQRFITAHPAFFRSGDIFDACPEPEQGNYWKATYGEQWTSNAPNTATRDYNAFIRATTDVADHALRNLGIAGVTTTIRSTNSFFASHADVFEQATADRLGQITIDSYPEKGTTDPAVAAQARVEELDTIERLWHLPIVIGEMGYSNQMEVDDATQQAVLKAEFDAIRPLPYLAGVNYWVGAGSNSAGGYTYILKKTDDLWSPRLAARELSTFYQTKLQQETTQPQCSRAVSFSVLKPC
ncbi:MAG TPA: hypothetical protein VKR06_32715 [Ktedonosporobacter sp.]|nr:hypothetical protein [Ktedonosporobacter sp.]